MILKRRILFGIYEDFNSSLNLDKDILEYYSDVLEQKSKHDNGCFAGEYHYYNIGVRALRDLLNKNNVKTYGRRIKNCVIHIGLDLSVYQKMRQKF